ncbi:ThiF family adenylyltransferase [Bradyrhizobium sp. CW7]|uniref:ThiF family adenylyltransferase n=1 Tax=Bradyrhizobium sp. CW7 TaxID=2782688 RepID=UPI001FFA52BB|nr:ThiF family adenylyltransferase [Bradyrhizobium sp. CW7]
MSLPLKATPAAGSTAQGLDAWFIGLGDDFLGRVPADSLRPGMVEGWRLRWRERELEVGVDADFPYSAARVYLVGFAREQAQPHIEKDGKLCLGSKAVPSDAVRTVQVALAEALQLLTENEARQHDEDFREDFAAYWLTWADRRDLLIEVLPDLGGARKTTLARGVRTEGRVFVFPNKDKAGKFWANLTGNAPKRLKETPLISIDPLPAPGRYPDTAAELWELVHTRSQGGTDLLARLMANTPMEAFIVLAGIAPSGREHYSGLRIRRPLDGSGYPIKRRAIREGIERTGDPRRTLFERFEIERLPTDRLDAGSTRLPEGVQREMSAAKVVVVGCGALGSGVARMLAQAGVEHLSLVDPEKLGWENIRRHELGGRAVGHAKAEALADSIRAALPMVSFVKGYQMTFAAFAREHHESLRQADLIVSCTGEWAADASVELALRQPGHKGAAVYGWMEAHALAAHAVLVGSYGARLADGFDEDGKFRMPVVAGGKPPPPECGGASTTFGAVELAHAQGLVARLAIDSLRKLETGPAWRSWLADAAAFNEAEATIAPDWVAARGDPDDGGGLFSGEWTFP